MLLGLAAFPLYWMLVTALTPSGRLFDGRVQAVPDLHELGVFAQAFGAIPVGLWLRNSAIVAAGTMVLSVALSVLPAYALSRFRFRGKGAFAFMLFATQMLPEAMLVVPLFSIFGQVGLLNSLTGLVLANTAFTLPVVTLILKGAIDALPYDIEEAATIDGCSRLGIVGRIVLPLVAPTLAAAGVIAFFTAGTSMCSRRPC